MKTRNGRLYTVETRGLWRQERHRQTEKESEMRFIERVRDRNGESRSKRKDNKRKEKRVIGDEKK